MHSLIHLCHNQATESSPSQEHNGVVMLSEVVMTMQHQWCSKSSGLCVVVRDTSASSLVLSSTLGVGVHSISLTNVAKSGIYCINTINHAVNRDNASGILSCH